MPRLVDLPNELLEQMLLHILASKPDRQSLALRAVHPRFQAILDPVLFAEVICKLAWPVIEADEDIPAVQLLGSGTVREHVKTLSIYTHWSPLASAGAQGECPIDSLLQLDLPALETLTFRRTALYYTPFLHTPLKPLAVFPSLRSVEIADAACALYLPHIVLKSPSLQRIAIGGICTANFEAMQRILQNQGGDFAAACQETHEIEELEVGNFELEWIQCYLAYLRLRPKTMIIRSNNVAWYGSHSQHMGAVEHLLDDERFVELRLEPQNKDVPWDYASFAGYAKETAPQRLAMLERFKEARGGRVSLSVDQWWTSWIQCASVESDARAEHVIISKPDAS